MAEERSSLLDWATGLASDPALRSRFAQEPRAVLDEQGLADVAPADLHHSLPLVTDSVAARLGVEVDVTAVSTADLLDGEDPVDVLTQHLGAATDLVVSTIESEDDPDQDTGGHDLPAGHRPPAPDGPHDDHDLDDFPVPHPATPVAVSTAPEATIMTTPTTSPGPAGDHTADLLARLDRFFTEAESHGLPRPATPEEFLAEYGADSLGRFFADYHPGARTGEEFRTYANDLLAASRTAPEPVVPVDTVSSTSTAVPPDPDLDGFDDPAAGGAGAGSGESFGADTDLDDLDAAGPAAAGGSTWTPQPDDPFIGWGDGTGGAGSAPAAGEADLDGFGSSSPGIGGSSVPHGDDPFADMVESQGGTMYPGADVDFGSSSSTGGGESIDSFGAGGDSSGGNDVGVSSDGSSSGEAGHDDGGLDDVPVPEPAREDPSAHDAADHGDAGAHDATDDSSDFSESFG